MKMTFQHLLSLALRLFVFSLSLQTWCRKTTICAVSFSLQTAKTGLVSDKQLGEHLLCTETPSCYIIPSHINPSSSLLLVLSSPLSLLPNYFSSHSLSICFPSLRFVKSRHQPFICPAPVRVNQIHSLHSNSISAGPVTPPPTLFFISL